MTAPTTIPTAPSPAKVDEFAVSYNQLKDEILAAFKKAEEDTKDSSASLSKLTADLKLLVNAFGSSHAEKSKLLNGIEWEMLLTRSSSTSIDNAAVEKMLKWAGHDHKKKEIVHSLFEGTIRWDLTPNATALIQAKSIPLKAKTLFGACLKIEPNTPSLKVRPRKAAEKSA